MRAIKVSKTFLPCIKHLVKSNLLPGEYQFYTEDCGSVGLVPTGKKTRLPTYDIPNFNEMEKNRAVLHDDLRDIEFKVANIANYFGNQEKLVEHIKEVNKYQYIT